MPQILFYLNPPKVVEPLPETTSYPTASENLESPENEVYITSGNRLQIAKIGVDTKILEDSSEDVLLREEGVWRDPITSKPGGGNMVIAGHRFQYLPPNTTTFYHLDKLMTGDEIIVYWEGKKHTYLIYDIFEVEPIDLWIKDSAENSSEITLYTCTPLYTSDKRLVVKAKESIN